MAIVAGVIDRGGGLRVVVTEPSHLHFHVNEGERCYVLPDRTVEEPVPFNQIPSLIAAVQRHIDGASLPD